MPALLTGFTMAFARGVGEYGSVIFIAGNLPMKTEITPLLIVIKLEQFDYAGAAAHRLHHAGDVVRDAAVDQSAAGMGATPTSWRRDADGRRSYQGAARGDRLPPGPRHVASAR